MIIDTHTHLYLPEYNEDRTEVMKRAIDSGVHMMIFPNVDLTTIEPMKDLSKAYPQNTRMAMGLHPTEVNQSWRETLSLINNEIDNSTDYVAIGEIGIDLYWDKTFEKEQMQAFDIQVNKAVTLGLPVIIHCRDGLDQVLEVLRGYPTAKGVFHSFGGTRHDVERIRNIGDYYFGINGVVTFKNCKVRETLPEITTERLLLETDAPYLSPVPYRGKRNETSYIIKTAQHIAEYLSMPFPTLAEVTTSNATNLFSL